MQEWEGSPDILDALSYAKDRSWALSYLRHCREQQAPRRALIASSEWVADRLLNEAGGALRALGVRVQTQAEGARGQS